jgi:DNA-binding transcriptional MerR regulator
MARASAKSPEAFRTISEAADVLDLPQHVLRFWETRFSQIKPMKRSGGRRYYRPSDIALLQGIRHLLYDEGYTIKGVQRILREQGIAHVVSFADQTVAGPPANPPAARPVPAPQPVAPTIGPAPDPPQISTPQTSLEPARPDPVRAALSGRTEPAPSAQPVTQQAPASPPVAAPLPHRLPRCRHLRSFRPRPTFALSLNPNQRLFMMKRCTRVRRNPQRHRHRS